MSQITWAVLAAVVTHHSWAANTCGIYRNSSIMSTGTNRTSRIVHSSGCPGYDWTSQTTPNSASYKCFTFVMPLLPIINTNVFYVGVYYDVNQTQPLASSSIVLGKIGVASNGVALYGNSDGLGRNAFAYEGMSFDQCDGHPDQFGTYHYHATPGSGCVYNDSAGQHSPLLGFMADGIPIYGIYADNGIIPTNLDVCGGHTDNTYPFYHYHSRNGTYPYLINCLRGCLNGSNVLQVPQWNIPPCSPGPVQYNYSSLVNVWPEIADYDCYRATSNASLAALAGPLSSFLLLLPLLLQFCLLTSASLAFGSWSTRIN